MVKLAPALPKESEHNGLEPNTRHILDKYPSQEYMPVVALIRTKEITSTEEFVRVPKIEVVAIEVALEQGDQDAVRELLQDLHDARVAHVKQPLDLPDVDEEPAELSEPLAIESAEEIVDAEVIDEDPYDGLAEADAVVDDDEDAPLALTGKA